MATITITTRLAPAERHLLNRAAAEQGFERVGHNVYAAPADGHALARTLCALIGRQFEYQVVE